MSAKYETKVTSPSKIYVIQRRVNIAYHYQVSIEIKTALELGDKDLFYTLLPGQFQ
jgi:hypothetical protein